MEQGIIGYYLETELLILVLQSANEGYCRHDGGIANIFRYDCFVVCFQMSYLSTMSVSTTTL